MVQNPSVFITATEARQSYRRDLAVHEEASGIQSAILQAVNLGLYETTVANGTPMTDSITPITDVWTVNTSTDAFYIPDHDLETGETVTVSSTVTLPSPLTSNTYYYVIFIDTDHIKLATSYADAISGRPINIDITSGVVSTTITNPGSGYLQAPVITLTGGSPTTPANLKSYLSTWGSVVAIANTTNGYGYADQPTVQIVSLGSGATVGTVTYCAVGVTVQNAGMNYHVGDLLSVLGGTGTATTVKVNAVDGSGSILSVSLANPGAYTTLPSTTNVATSVSPGGGVSATLNLTMGISAIAIASGGTGYVAAPQVIINSGSGVGATATATIYGGVVSGIVITNSGYGYLGVSSIVLDSGSNATAVAMMQPTSVSSAIVTNSGSGYTAPPAVTITPFGTGAVAGQVTMKVVNLQLTSGGINYIPGDILLVSGGIASENAWIRVASVSDTGAITSYVLEDGGSYSSLPGITANPVNGGSGTLAAFNLIMGVNSVAVSASGTGYTVPPVVTLTDPVNGGVTATIDAILTAGTVSTFLVTDPGFNYDTIPTVTISNGSGATGQAIMNGTVLGSITVTSGGSGYTSATVTIVGGGYSSQATATANIVGGTIVGINLLSGGAGYTTLPDVIITGNGVNAAATAVMAPTGVSSIAITNAGSGFNTPPRITIAGDATADAVLTGTGIQRIVVTSQGSNYAADPAVYLIPGIHQVTTPEPPVMVAQRAYGIDSIGIFSSGIGYQSTPTLTMSGPYFPTGNLATATATIGSGLGTFTLTPYRPSRDYYKAWKGQQLSNDQLARPYTEQMDTVIAYFTNLGYTINRISNPSTNNTFMWKVQW